MGPSEYADLILTGARVYTMDAARSWGEAVAVKDGRILAAGSARSVAETKGPSTRMVDLPGRFVIPGFQDAHVHALHGGLYQTRCELHDVSGREHYIETIKSYAAEHPDREWILGGGWYMEFFPRGTPDKALLDDVVPDRPVFLYNRDVHGAWVNSAALKRAGISKDSPEPSGGRIERDAAGEPQGTLHEHAMDLVARLVPETTHEERLAGLRAAQSYLHSLGITSWQDPWILEEDLRAYLALDEAGGLSARVLLDLLWERDQGEEQLERLKEQRQRGTVGRVRATGIKIFQDGIAENFTAAMLEPYLDDAGKPTGNAGISMIEPRDLNRFVTMLDAEGFQVHFHAIGDRAVRESLDAVEAARSTNGTRDARHHICHLQVVDRDDIARFRRLGVVANCQPLWACNEEQMSRLTIPFLGPERSRRQYPFASLRRAGATLAFGSDWSVSSPNPLLEMQVAIERTPVEDRDTEPFLPEERLDLPASLAAFTIGSAFVNHHEDATGSVEPGKLADLAILDRDVFEPEAGPLGDASVIATLVDGEVVFDDGSAGF